MNLFKKYVDSALWAVMSLVGCCVNIVSPRTLQEVIITNFVFVIGILLLAKIFSDFASVLHLFDLEDLKIREKSLRALKLCKVLGLPSRIRYKVEAYYAGTNDAYSQSNIEYLRIRILIISSSTFSFSEGFTSNSFFRCSSLFKARFDYQLKFLQFRNSHIRLYNDQVFVS